MSRVVIVMVENWQFDPIPDVARYDSRAQQVRVQLRTKDLDPLPRQTDPGALRDAMSRQGEGFLQIQEGLQYLLSGPFYVLISMILDRKPWQVPGPVEWPSYPCTRAPVLSRRRRTSAVSSSRRTEYPRSPPDRSGVQGCCNALPTLRDGWTLRRRSGGPLPRGKRKHPPPWPRPPGLSDKPARRRVIARRKRLIDEYLRVGSILIREAYLRFLRSFGMIAGAGVRRNSPVGGAGAMKHFHVMDQVFVTLLDDGTKLENVVPARLLPKFSTAHPDVLLATQLSPLPVPERWGQLVNVAPIRRFGARDLHLARQQLQTPGVARHPSTSRSHPGQLSPRHSRQLGVGYPQSGDRVQRSLALQPNYVRCPVLRNYGMTETFIWIWIGE